MREGAPTDVIEVAESIDLSGVVVRRPTVVRASARGASITTLEGASILAPLVVGPGVSLAECRFHGAVGLERLDVSVGDRTFAPGGRRRVVADEYARASRDDAELTHIYRQLRGAMLRSGQYDVAAEFHEGELEARRRLAPWWSPSRWWLTVYRWFGGYGHRPSRPLFWYVVLVVGVAFVLHRSDGRFDGGDVIVGSNDLVRPEHFMALLFRVVVQTTLFPLSPIEVARVHTDGYVVLLAARLLTIFFIVTGSLGVWSRLRR